MRRVFAAILLVSGCKFVSDNKSPGGIDGDYTGRVTSTDSAWMAPAVAYLKTDGLTVTGTIAVLGSDCFMAIRLRGTRDARYFGGVLTSSTSTMTFDANTLLDRIIASYDVTDGAACIGGTGRFEFTKNGSMEQLKGP